MISLICTNCQAELTMDDAFAGGVCRCQYCGTIQTVPTTSTGTTRATASKALYQKESATVPDEATGVEGLAQTVGTAADARGSFASSQAASTATAEPASAEGSSAERRRGAPVLPIAVVLAILLLAGLSVAIFLYARSQRAHAGIIAPNFAGVPINASSVIYLLDNGNSNETLFDPLKAACFKSIETLGPDRKFQVMLWDNGLASATYPIDGMHNATATELDACKRAFADTVATGNSHLAGPLKQALTQKPGAIVIATGKWELDRDDLAALASAGETGVRIYSFGLGTAPEQGALKLAATGTGGQYKHLSTGELNHASD